MTDSSFITNLKDKTDSFLLKLIEQRKTGNKIITLSLGTSLIAYSL
jgi:hypothetical protein